MLEQFDDMLVKILFVAAFISFVLAYLHGHESGKGFEAYVEPRGSLSLAIFWNYGLEIRSLLI